MTTTASHSITIRLEHPNNSSTLSAALAKISSAGGLVGAIDLVKIEDGNAIRDITVDTTGEKQQQKLISSLEKIEGLKVRNVSDRTFVMHLGGKIEVNSKIPVTHRDELSMAYTPGVARVCEAIQHKPSAAFNLTIKANTVAVVTDGTAVLGLGDIGPLAALPVMEGKAMLLKEFADVNAFPICLDTKDPQEIIDTVIRIAPSFGAINLEDIAAPNCFMIEQKLSEALDIPVFHDDQHGTAVVTTAAVLNAVKIVGKKLTDLKVVFSGVGAAGTACKDMLLDLGVTNIIGCDRQGALTRDRKDLNTAKRAFAESTNPNNEAGNIHDVITDADIFIGLSAPNSLSVRDIKKMHPDPIIFAMANPTPEIMPELANPHVAIMATGRSDYPNQINNLLAFPGIFRGALDCKAKEINRAMKLAAAYAIANIIDDASLSPDYIIPSVFNGKVVRAVALAVKKAARETGVAKK